MCWVDSLAYPDQYGRMAPWGTILFIYPKCSTAMAVPAIPVPATLVAIGIDRKCKVGITSTHCCNCFSTDAITVKIDSRARQTLRIVGTQCRAMPTLKGSKVIA